MVLGDLEPVERPGVDERLALEDPTPEPEASSATKAITLIAMSVMVTVGCVPLRTEASS